MKDYLQAREMRTLIRDKNSNWCEVTSGGHTRVCIRTDYVLSAYRLYDRRFKYIPISTCLWMMQN